MAKDRALDLARQLWLQSMLSNRQISSFHGEALYKKALSLSAEANGRGADPLVPGSTAPSFIDFCSSASQMLERVGFDLRFYTEQATGTECIAIVNDREDLVAQEFGSAYTKLELAYIKRIIKAMFTAPGMRYSVPYSSALRLASQEEGSLTRRAAQDLIYNMQLHGWFVEVHDHTRLALAPRALLELRESLVSEFDVRKCVECGELVVMGAACGNTSEGQSMPEVEGDIAPCGFAFHARCSKAALSQHIRAERAQGTLGRDEQGPRSCPLCKGDWAPIVVGEGGTEDADDGENLSASEEGMDNVPIEPRAAHHTERLNAPSFIDYDDEAGEEEVDVEEEEDEDEDEDAEEQPRRVRRRYH